MKFIKEITALETFSVRQPVLRPGKPIETCHFDGDNLPTTKHFGVFEDEILAGVITVLENNSILFDKKKQFQIRGMAVLDSFQKKGLGKDLVIAVEKYVENQKGELIWFNARMIAVEFYKKMGYKTIGEIFEINDVGPHYVMFKDIQEII